jgi:AdoMet-dependent heme synthase
MATTEFEILGERRVAADSRLVPHVVAWNLTQRCNLACAHCYIAAGSWHAADGELSTAECRRIADEILELNDSPMFILSGGEPLLRDDLEDIAKHASRRGATVVIGTNGTRLTRERIRSLLAAGVKGAALSIDSLDATYHDRFRHGGGALADTLSAVDRLGEEQLDFIVQTTVTRGNRGELKQLAAYAAEHGAVSFNVYFLVPTGRGQKMLGLSPAENEQVLGELIELEQQYRGRMLVRSKCMPQIMRHAYERDPQSPLLNYETRCPCGLHYCRITPEGKVTPCPYSPAVAGDLRQQSFAEVWQDSPLFTTLRTATLGGKCGTCEYREICGGCRARAFAETGDVLAEDSSCAYEPTGSVAPVARRTAATYGAPATAQLEWTPEARARLERIPSFVRAVVSERVERFARERGHTRVTAELMAEIRQAMPVDFSKRLPFFARRSEP